MHAENLKKGDAVLEANFQFVRFCDNKYIENDFTCLHQEGKDKLDNLKTWILGKKILTIS